MPSTRSPCCKSTARTWKSWYCASPYCCRRSAAPSKIGGPTSYGYWLWPAIRRWAPVGGRRHSTYYAGSAPLIAGLRLRAGRANSAKGAARMLAQAIRTARAISADTTILVRGDSAFGSRAVVGTCIRHRAQFSVAMARNSAIDKTIAAIGDRLDPGPEQRPEDVGVLCQRLHHCRRSRRRE